MARHSKPKGPKRSITKNRNLSINIKYLITLNILLNLAILYFLKFS